MNVCVSPKKCICWNIISSVMAFGSVAFGMWLANEGKDLMNGICALKKSLESSLPLLPYKFIGSSLCLDAESAGTLILNVWAWRSMSNKFLMSISHSVYALIKMHTLWIFFGQYSKDEISYTTWLQYKGFMKSECPTCILGGSMRDMLELTEW